MDVSFQVIGVVPADIVWFVFGLNRKFHTFDTFFEVNQLINEHTFLRLEDLIVHVVVEAGNALQTQCFLEVLPSNFTGLHNILGYFLPEAKLGELSNLPDQQDQFFTVVNPQHGILQIQLHNPLIEFQAVFALPSPNFRNNGVLPLLELLSFERPHRIVELVDLFFELRQVVQSLEQLLAVVIQSPNAVGELTGPDYCREGRREVFGLGDEIFPGDRVQ